jgi:type I restriction enzyme S subunit
MKFEVVKLGEYLTLQKGISYTSSNLVDNSDSGLLTINAFTPGGGYKPNSEKPYEGNIDTNYLLSDGDVLVAMTEQDSGLLASPLVINRGKTSFANLTFSLDVGRFVKKQEGLEPRYIFNLLRIPAFRIRAAYGDSGSTVQRLPYEALYEQKVPKPTLEVQNAIINFIDKLDEKIFTNSSTSKTLEDIAQTIFKSWFIDFDPVKAKMNGEKPIGMDDETAALFPDSFEESELGLIPKGWKSGSLGDLFELQGGFAFKSSSWTDTGVPVIKIGSVKPGFIDFGQVSYVSEEFANEIPDDYRLTAGSLVVGLTGYVGEVGLARSHFPVPLINQRVAKFKSKSEEWKLPFIYCVTRNPKFKATVEELATGTAQQNVSNAQILSIPIVKPTKEVLTYFEDMLNSYFEQIINLADENETLKSLRDSLLPRLISGELQIPEEMLAS